jgi:hypothetical protein
MIVTQSDARKILARVYPNMGTPVRLTTACTVGVRPVYETELGLPTLAWRKVATGKDSAVRIGRFLPGGAIDWSWDNTGAQS